MSDKTLLEKNNKTNKIPNEKTKYTCNVVLQIQSVYYIAKDKGKKYYPQVLLGERNYKGFSNNKLIHPILIFSDTEPDSESYDSDESEEEINEDIVRDE